MLVLSHDEVVHGKRALLAKMPGDLWQQFANLRALYAFHTLTPARKCSSWAGSSASGTSGMPSRAWTGTCWTRNRTSSSSSWWRI